MEQITNTFNEGLNKDVSKIALKNSQYRDARNIRITSDEHDSTLAVTNVFGNKFALTIPDVSNVIKLEIVRSFPLGVSLTINGVVVTGFVNNYQELADLINKKFELQSPNINPLGLGIVAAASSNYILIYSLIYNNLTVTSNISVSNLGNLNLLSNQSAQTGLKLIGWGTIRDDIYIFTTNNDSLNPGGHDTSLISDPSSIGQIFKLVLDRVNYTITAELKYNNSVDFTSYHPFRKEGQVEGRYENDETQRLYWTDNFNELRRLNVGDSNCFATDIDSINLKPSINFDTPILDKINDSGGTVSIGNFQCAYRMKTLGVSTKFSRLSNIVNIINSSPESTSFRDYVAVPPPLAPSGSGKSITWTIDNLDTNYETIEVAIIFKLNRTDSPTIYTILEDNIPSDGKYTFTFTGFETKTPIDISEFNDVSQSFTHCKTITSKDNLLLAANTRTTSFDSDFDARAYRWPGLNDPLYDINITQVKNSQGVLQNVDKRLTDFGVPETHDCINIDQYTQEFGGYRFQSDGITIGGEGPYIKYKFKSLPFISDTVNSSSVYNTSPPYIENSRFVNRQAGPYNLNSEDYKNNNFYESLKSEYLASIYKGYQHDEVYSFGIVFYDKSGTPGFVKWIADIRMPLIHEAIYASGANYDFFPLTDLNGYSNSQRSFILVPEFTVTLTQDIKDRISGWEIVRCVRNTEDKSILAAGIIHHVAWDNFGAEYFACTTQDFTLPVGSDPYGIFSTDPPANDQTVESEIIGFRSPDFLFSAFPGYSSGDKIKITTALTHPLSTTYFFDAPAGFNNHKMVKLYQHRRIYDDVNGGVSPYIERIIDNNGCVQLSKGQQTTLTGTVGSLGLKIHNRTNEAGHTQSVGGATLIIEFFGDNPISYNQITGVNPNHKFYAYYVRPRQNQYGGNTYSSRSNRKYISCGQFINMNSNTPLIMTAQITGGDVYVPVFDTVKQFKNWPVAGDLNAVAYFYPVESSLNTEWRYGISTNRYGFNDNGTALDTKEDFLYNPSFSTENNVKEYFPKPFNFKEVNNNDCRIYASQYKINGETLDSWTDFKPNDFIDVDSKYGKINNLQILNNNVIGLQDKAIFHLPINEKITIPDSSTSTLVLGTGDKIVDPNYITTESGCMHQFGNICSEKGLYYYDIYNNTLNRVTGVKQPISIIKGLDSWFKSKITGDIKITDNPVKPDKRGIICAFDKINEDVLFTFHDNSIITSETIAFSEKIDSFSSFYDFKPSLYINSGTNLISPSPDNTSLYIHDIKSSLGVFYGNFFDSKLKFIINPKVKEAVFDNFTYTAEMKDINDIPITDQTWNTIQVTNDYQNSSIINLNNNINIKRKKRAWNLSVPRSSVISNLSNIDILDPVNLDTTQLFKSRMRGDYIEVELTLINGLLQTRRRIIMPYWNTIFRISKR